MLKRAVLLDGDAEDRLPSRGTLPESVASQPVTARGKTRRNPAHDNTAGDISMKHVRDLIDEVRDSLDALVAAGVKRSALEERLQRLESAAASGDKGLIHETLVELKGLVTNGATKLVSTGVLPLIDQILGFPSP